MLTNTKSTIAIMDPDDNIVDRVVYKEQIREYVRIFPFYFIIIMLSARLACAIEF